MQLKLLFKNQFLGFFGYLQLTNNYLEKFFKRKLSSSAISFVDNNPQGA
jgi:hypothetical protein